MKKIIGFLVFFSSSIALAADLNTIAASLPGGHISLIFIIIGVLNASSGILDWIAKTIPGEKDDKVIAGLKNVICAIQKVIDLFIGKKS